ncbi:2,3-bisphosphoglycerate-independent phosphoglycerate mutase [Candidatus Wolfebacteria bacterium]|nr:2,3-bisphosphoglycerate-independent phosphoglycerate mutase [Candidatus Wolfebacteria bacterium]
MSKRPVILVILDGWGIGKKHESNPIFTAQPKTIEQIKTLFPSGSLQASGISVGLPWGEPGNSEAGHVTLGAGKIIYQYYPKITIAIRDGSFFINPVIGNAVLHAKKNNSTLHLVGLISQNNTHSSLEHLEALIAIAKKEGIDDRYRIHAIADGRDSKPRSIHELLERIPGNRVASIIGRFYAMDTERRWERVGKAYKALMGTSPVADDVASHINKTYAKNLNDDYIDPVLIGPDNHGIKANDAVIFFNFRGDGMEELVSAFAAPDFNKFPVEARGNLHIATMTPYNQTFALPAAFLPDEVHEPLAKTLQDNGKTQLKIAEAPKYRHVTYFFNGLREEPFENEYRVLVPTKGSIHIDEHPEMQIAEVTTRIVGAIEDRAFDFILANFANPDAVAHTGNYAACVSAIEAVDNALEKIKAVALDKDAILIITSDHGNIERLYDPLTGIPETGHDANPVPIYLIAKEWERGRLREEIEEGERATSGILADVAPTILELMNIKKPKEMTGESLLSSLVG